MSSQFDAWSMPYVFPHEGVFVLVVGVLIIGLLIARVRVARRRQRENRAER